MNGHHDVVAASARVAAAALVVAAMIAGAACARPPAGAPPPDAAASDAPQPDRDAGMPVVLYVTHSAGYRHAVLEESVATLSDLGAAHGFAVEHVPDAAALDAAAIARADAIAFFTTGDLPMTDDAKEALLRFVDEGGGLVGFHSATDTFPSWPAWRALIGGAFDGHPWTEAARLVVEDAAHPATAHLGPAWDVDDELYQFQDWSRDAVHVLLSLDTSTVDLAAPGVRRADGDFALAWTREVGSGRVFYTALGHRPETWRSDAFRRHVVGGVRWALRRP